MEFSEKLKQLRAQHGISQAKLAEAIHISRSAVAKWENGLGLPSEDSMNLLAAYFDVPIEDFTESHETDKKLVNRNRIIGKQRNTITILLVIIAGLVTILAAYLHPPFREFAFPFVIGLMLSGLGIFNMRGNIATIHWYNRRKVKKEDQKIYCILIGLGTLLIGIGIVYFSVMMSFSYPVWMEYCPAVLMVLGLLLMLYSQFKYNRGLF